MKFKCGGIYLLFYCLLTINISNGNVIKGQQWTYSYKGQIDTSSSACDKSLARWTITGTLIGQSFDNYMIFKLEDLKTSIFNGDRDDLKLSQEKFVPSQAEVLKKPFIIRKNNHNVTIELEPNEPLWSLNMKRAIGSHFQIDFERGFDGEFIEHSLYGDCPINYISDKIGDEIVVNKIINHDKCKNHAFKHKTNVVRAKPTLNYNPFKIETVKKYLLKDYKSILVVSDTYSISNITYKPMNILPYTQNIDQYQEFKMLNQSKINQVINSEKNTVTHKIIYEIDMESLLDNGPVVTNPDEQISALINNYENLKEKFNRTLEHFNINEEDPIENMFNLLYTMKTETLQKLNQQIKQRDDTFNITLLTLMPYIGTADATNFIIDLLKNDFNYEGKEYLGMKFFATFPRYLENVDDKLLKKFEFLLDLKTNVILKNAAILCFSTILQNSQTGEEKFTYYKNMLHDRFKNSQEYNDKMTYLLSLVNIAEKLEVDFILELLISADNEFLRTLGINGFKQRLIHHSDKSFDKFWPIVQNDTDVFNVRVAALDLLLSSNLSKKQFDEIVEFFIKPQKTIFNKHLYQYFCTSMIAYQNITKFTDPMGSYASEFLQNPVFLKQGLNFYAWGTSKFRLAYTDKAPNFGRNFEGNIVANPLTNHINSMQLTYNHFVMSFDMGTYTVYLKFDEVFHRIYKQTLLVALEQTHLQIQDLLDLIQKFNIQMKEEQTDYHVEIVVFIDFKAVAAITIGPENQDEMVKNLAYGMALTENMQEIRVTFPLYDYVSFTSDLGTPLTIKHDVQDLFAGQHPRMDLNVRDSWYHQIWMESYNPLVKAPIASYKYYGYEIRANILMDLNLRRFTFAVYHEDNSVEYINSQNIGTSVGGSKELLQTYCEKCENNYEIPNDDFTYDKLIENQYFTINFNRTRGKHIQFTNTSDRYWKNVLDSFYCNADILPIMKPVLLAIDSIETDQYFERELSHTSYRSIPYYPDMTMTFMKLKNNKEENLDQLDPIQASNYLNYTLEFSSSSVEDEEVKLHWTSTIVFQTIVENINETDKPKIPQTYLNWDFDFVEYNISRSKAFIQRKLTFPEMNPDKFTIEPVGPTIGTTVMEFCETEPDCPDNYTIILREKFWLSDERKNSIMKSDDYKNCQKQKNGLKFTPLTKSCVLDSHEPLSYYDSYEMFAEFYDGVGKDNDIFAEPFLTYTVPSPRKLHFTLLKFPIINPRDRSGTWNKTIDYYGRYATPTPFGYNDHEVIVGIKRACIVSSTIIKTFTEDVKNFDAKYPVAFVECLEKPTRGLTIEQVNNKNIGFHFWALNNTVIGTMVDDQLKITLNGDEIKQTYFNQEQKFKITFLEKNVVIISEKEVEIYYNTEYLYTKLLSVYATTLCGFCAYN